MTGCSATTGVSEMDLSSRRIDIRLRGRKQFVLARSEQVQLVRERLKLLVLLFVDVLVLAEGPCGSWPEGRPN